ncbi:hypothetical protein TS71_24795 [Mycolicibacterium neoaurum]|uniref:Mycothiol-dependent maleylpyruvate isomerase metal-binding domain-containing protein n=3 Tax=Mycobacteriaceae TaxID=1762 RepID=V5XCR7_MYCNE|nr:hypothetical protein D174_14970 [Mycolicibacterium neoaurum VKM Ac-1815D]AXK75430.1 TIGR03086 family protein [Mycolicibacterium neoaurum]KJQ47815.1 hypothetical protein TS71_24795 [Mycolicibacterium neoaurum]KUM05840.1 hypothetical protein AVZ31_24640 [Mycolicibacterium neoaurum]
MASFGPHNDAMNISGSRNDVHTDPRRTLDRAMATAGGVISEVRPQQLTGATPCVGMDVRALLAHLVGVLERIAALGLGANPLAVNDSAVDDDRWLDAWWASAGRATDAWIDDALLDRHMALPWIEGAGAKVLASYVSELTVHTWDLAVATGQRPEWDDEVVEEAFAAMRGMLPVENRLTRYEEISAARGFDEVTVPFAEAVTIAQDASAIERLVAWTGRDPRRFLDTTPTIPL